ncbi:MAG: DUF2959 domain-containing protein [Gammaproteobacteria bacterium]|nr:DUF2959 domain-containing protein [Gammaproteobacteria bacterium]
MQTSKSTTRIISISFFTLALLGCQSAYYGALEKVGIHKRDVMVSRVESANETQLEAKQQFQTALQKFKSVRQFNGGNLENIYETLNDEYETSAALADKINSRINDIESVSDALFEEWEKELSEYTSESLKQKSAQQLTKTKSQYRRLIRAMKNAETSMKPVLNVFKDQVLFLKHNLNAQAIASLKGELNNIESNVATLIKQMNKSIDEANQFIKTMSQ